MSITKFNHNVQWNEFTEKNQRPNNTQEDAYICATFRYSYNTQSPPKQACHVTAVNISITVSRAESWVIRGQQNAILLRHEQGHYDITALGAREIHDRIFALSATQCSTINSQAQQIEREVQRLITQTNTRYDNQTNHGSNAAAQQRWESSPRNAKQNANGKLSDLS
jgi:predicted secreted Zn-dependent protease